ncbi:MAG: hypothetical protein OXF75_06935 [Acidimicrobiaceae bacterium]|nr:hypothetical protein [Acidimicrobiaceae bacterium]
MRLRTKHARIISAISTAVAAIVLLSACSGERDAAECADVAEAQANAESDWAEALQTHNAAHAEGHDHDTHDELTALRVRVINAEAEVRRVCG